MGLFTCLSAFKEKGCFIPVTMNNQVHLCNFRFWTIFLWFNKQQSKLKFEKKGQLQLLFIKRLIFKNSVNLFHQDWVGVVRCGVFFFQELGIFSLYEISHSGVKHGMRGNGMRCNKGPQRGWWWCHIYMVSIRKPKDSHIQPLMVCHTSTARPWQACVKCLHLNWF